MTQASTRVQDMTPKNNVLALGRIARILLVEDSAAEVVLIQGVFKKHRVRNQIHVVNDSKAALDYLTRQKIESDCLPDLVLLDLNMPVLTGWDVMAEIDRDPILKKIPILILSGSDEVEDKINAEKQGASGFMVKPFNFSSFKEHIDRLERLCFFDESDEVAILVRGLE